MSTWDTPEESKLLEQAIKLLQDGGVLEPTSIGSSSPLDMRGVALPTVTERNIAATPTVIARRITGRLEFNNATLRSVDFSNAHLDFSVWNNCVFERIAFDRTKLHQVRFFGCRFSDCTFHSSDLRDSSFSVATNGSETEVVRTIFEKADFRGASCSNPVFRFTSFLNCKLENFIFDGAQCEDVTFAGKYKELTFRGIPNETERNRPKIDLCNVSLMWLHADFGIDLRDVGLPADGSCLILKDRLRAVPRLSTRLTREAGPAGTLVSNVLTGLFSERALAALEASQDMVLISKAMIADFAETNDANVVNAIFSLIRSICQSDGYLVA